MANTRELRRRIRSVKNTSQITKAMQMVAATKMRKAQNQALSGRPYSSTLSLALGEISGKINPELHPLLGGPRHPERSEGSPTNVGSEESETSSEIPRSARNDNGKTGVLLLTTDKALCGALNTNVLRALQNSSLITHHTSLFYTVGKKGRDFVVKTGKTLEADFENLEKVEFRQARQIANTLIQAFLEGFLKKVYIIYPDFVSALRQEPKIVKLLPIDSSVILSAKHEGSLSLSEKKSETSSEIPRSARNDKSTSSEFLFEPNVDELLDFVLTHNVQTQIYQALLETKASEHSARMMAMQNATDNAKELVQDLNLTYNQTRQDAITRELLEITTAAAALE